MTPQDYLLLIAMFGVAVHFVLDMLIMKQNNPTTFRFDYSYVVMMILAIVGVQALYTQLSDVLTLMSIITAFVLGFGLNSGGSLLNTYAPVLKNYEIVANKTTSAAPAATQQKASTPVEQLKAAPPAPPVAVEKPPEMPTAPEK